MKHFWTFLFMAACAFGACSASAEDVELQTTLRNSNTVWTTTQNVVVTFSDPRTPNCKIFAARLKYKEHQQQQLLWLLNQMNLHKGVSSDAAFAELIAMQDRYMKLEEELKNQKISLYATIDLQSQGPNDVAAIAAKAYRLTVQMPGLTWQSLDSTAPFEVKLSYNPVHLIVETDWNLLNFCFSNRKIAVTLDL